MQRTLPYKLRFGKNGDPNITNATSTTAAEMDDTWTWQCPKAMKILLKKGDILSAYVTSGTNNEVARPDALIQIEVRDPTGSQRINVFGPENYDSITELQDSKSLARLDLDEPILLKHLDKLVIMTQDDTAMVAADISTNSFGWIDCLKIID